LLMVRSVVHVPSFLIGIATSIEVGARRQWRTIVVDGVRGMGRLGRLRVWRGVVLRVWRRVGVRVRMGLRVRVRVRVRVGVRMRVVVRAGLSEELVDGGGGLVVWLRLRLGVVVSVMGSRADGGQVIIAR
jgi:hypothetical protein